jgi:hypothetical protein
VTRYNQRSKLKLCLLTVFPLSACYSKPSEAEQLKKRVFYWTMTGAESCVKMSGVPYCFLKKDIEAQSFPTDSGAGFLFMAPTDDPVLVDCAKDWYKVDWEDRPYPNIHMTVSEAGWIDDKRRDTIADRYKRMHDLELNIPSTDVGFIKNDHIVEPRQYIYYFGEQCLKLNEKDLIGREALCYGGDFNKGDLAYFWGCNKKNGHFTNPSCKYSFFYKNLAYGFTTSKKCAPYMHKIRDFVINFVDAGESRFQKF